MEPGTKGASEPQSIRLKNAGGAAVPTRPGSGITNLLLPDLEVLSRDINKSSDGYLLLLLISYFFVTAAHAIRPQNGRVRDAYAPFAHQSDQISIPELKKLKCSADAQNHDLPIEVPTR
jgi:hypothetical protein